MDINLTDSQKKVLEGKICPYCGRETVYEDSSAVYGVSYGMIYRCKPCDAYCGVHKGTNVALGRVANAELRQAKKEAHSHFDLLWKLKLVNRQRAYQLLANHLGLPSKYCHIGMFSVETCQRVKEWSKTSLIKLKTRKK